MCVEGPFSQIRSHIITTVNCILYCLLPLHVKEAKAFVNTCMCVQLSEKNAHLVKMLAMQSFLCLVISVHLLSISTGQKVGHCC